MRKKLIAVTCVVAIIVFGACEAEPPTPNLPAPPALPIPGLSQIRSMAIQVRDDSGGDLVDGDALSRAVVTNWNTVLGKQQVRFYVMERSIPRDATLKIVLLRKDVSCEVSKSGRQRCDLKLITSSTLTDREGRLLWKRPHEDSECSFGVTSDTRPNSWESDAFLEDAAYCLSFTRLPGSLH
jgi:hypothetical protein